MCNFWLVGDLSNQIASIARSAMEARNFLGWRGSLPNDVPSQLSYTPKYDNNRQTPPYRHHRTSCDDGGEKFANQKIVTFCGQTNAELS